MRLNEILFPTDFSPASDVAGRIAREMALQAGARLHVLHVMPRSPIRSCPPSTSRLRAAVLPTDSRWRPCC